MHIDADRALAERASQTRRAFGGEIAEQEAEAEQSVGRISAA